MIDRLKELAKEYDALELSLQSPDVFNNLASVTEISKKMSALEKAHALYKEYLLCENILKDSEEMRNDPDMRDLALEEEEKTRKRLALLEAQIQIVLVPKDPMDQRNAILEVRAGTGGEEASLFAAELVRMYLRYAENMNWTTALIDKTDADGGGVKEAILEFSGNEVFGFLKFEGGVHRVQRIPETENKGRVHTSAATVAVLPEAVESDIVIRNEDLRIDTYRASGAGGQHVNKTDSAVRITHAPSGVVVSCQSERSQTQNKMKCMELLRTKLYASKAEKEASEKGNMRSSQIGTGDRSEKIRTYNFPQDRLTDHRINQSFHNLPGIMEGGIGEVIDALRVAVHQEQLTGAA